TREEEEESFDPIPRTPEDSEDDGNGEEDQELRVSKEQRLIEEEEADELYRDVDINQGRGLQVSQDIKDSHVTLTPVKPDSQQESSSVSSFVTSMLNPISDAGVESIFTTASSPIPPLQTPTPIMTPSTIATITTSSDAPIPPTTIPSETNQFTEVVSNIPGIIHQYMNQQMTEAVREAVQIQTDRLRDSFQREIDEFLRTIDENMKRIIKGSSHSSRTSYVVAADLTKMELKKILIEKMEGNKEDVGMMMIRKDPPLDQTGGRRDEEKVGGLNQLALHPNQQPEVQAGLQHGLNLDRCQPLSLLLQRNLCRLPVRWTNPHIRCLKQRRRGDDNDQEGPFAGLDRGSKRRREGGEPESASTPSEPATRSASRSTTGTQSRQMSASESAFTEELVQTTCLMDEPPHPVIETGAEDQPIAQNSQHPEWFSSQGNLQHQIVIGTRPYQLFKEALRLR
nr:hypothetical protein [Tanacetum cinerariifolium]